MRAQKDMTQYQSIDLGDQPKGKYLLRFQYGDGPSTVLWVDDLAVVEGQMTAVRGKEPVASFSPSANWLILAADLVETFTVAELQDRVYTDMVTNEETIAQYKKLYEYRQGQTGRKPQTDEEDWR